ncbi:MAG: hypothetical protein ACXVCX_02925, partial [Ktedonobacterales bacterium]
SLPVGLFFAYYMSQSRVRGLGVLGGLLGAIVAGVALYFAIAVSGITVDTLSYFFGAFFFCSTGVVAGALLANILAGSGGNSGASPAH